MVDENELLDEGLKSLLGGITLFISMIASGQEIPPEKINTLKTEISNLTPEQKEVVSSKLTDEQILDIEDATGIKFTSDAANRYFKYEPKKEFKALKVPELNLGRYAEIKAAKVINVSDNDKGGYKYTVELNSTYGSADNFSNVRRYIGKNNINLKDSVIEFINQNGETHLGSDITYK